MNRDGFRVFSDTGTFKTIPVPEPILKKRQLTMTTLKTSSALLPVKAVQMAH